MRPLSSRAIRRSRERNGLEGMRTLLSACLFRRHPGIYYVGRVHEHVEPRIHALGLELASADLVIHHFGHLCSPAELRTKNEFYRKLGRHKVKDIPNDPEAWVELGLQGLLGRNRVLQQSPGTQTWLFERSRPFIGESLH
jgi:hypothetical protein